jgi:hypothetical protein
MEAATQTARPRAFYPDYAGSARIPQKTPGWDLSGPERRLDDGRTLARSLGWFSFGLGAVEVLAPKRVTRFLGVSDSHAPLVRLYGMREVASGLGIMAERTPAAGVWSRVAGDALDLATLSLALTGPSRRRDRVLTAMVVVAGAMAVDTMAAKKLTQRRADEQPRRQS